MAVMNPATRPVASGGRGDFGRAGGEERDPRLVAAVRMVTVLRVAVRGCFFFFSSRRRHTRYIGDWSSDVCSSDLGNSSLCHNAAVHRLMARAIRLLAATSGVLCFVQSAHGADPYSAIRQDIAREIADRKSVV